MAMGGSQPDQGGFGLPFDTDKLKGIRLVYLKVVLMMLFKTWLMVDIRLGEWSSRRHMNKQKLEELILILGYITALKKLCNHPKLIYDTIRSGNPGTSGFEDCIRFFPPEMLSGRWIVWIIFLRCNFSHTSFKQSFIFLNVEVMLVLLIQHLNQQLVCTQPVS
ncbi:unnamed protein product [Lupinus luteus]|uniref:Uncharacterized protein n=1 Tax=Lupinus luteus TaxID=3873 RepID=A0AAV1W4M9_LUPLU